MITELREERACLDEALHAAARTTHGYGKRRLKKLARSLIAGAADESISLFDVHYDQMFHRGPPPTAKLSGRDRFSKPHQTSSAPFSISSGHSSASTTKKRSRAQSSLANWPPVWGASLGSASSNWPAVVEGKVKEGEHTDDPASSRRAGVGRPPDAGDLRALSPLKWQHINPYGTFTLNMSERLPLA